MLISSKVSTQSEAKPGQMTNRFFIFLLCSSLNDTTLRGVSLQQISKSKISQQLHEMNEQFDAIEQLTNNMEQDLQRSNRVRICFGNILPY